MFIFSKWEKLRRQDDVCGVTETILFPSHFPSLLYTSIGAGASFVISKVSKLELIYISQNVKWYWKSTHWRAKKSSHWRWEEHNMRLGNKPQTSSLSRWEWTDFQYFLCGGLWQCVTSTIQSALCCHLGGDTSYTISRASKWLRHCGNGYRSQLQSGSNGRLMGFCYA